MVASRATQPAGEVTLTRRSSCSGEVGRDAPGFLEEVCDAIGTRTSVSGQWAWDGEAPTDHPP